MPEPDYRIADDGTSAGPHFALEPTPVISEWKVPIGLSPTHEDLARQLDQILKELREMAERMETLHGSESTTRDKAPPVPQEPLHPSGMTPTSS